MSNALKHLNLFITFSVRFKEANVKALAFLLHTYQSFKKGKKKKLKKKTKKQQKKTTKKKNKQKKHINIFEKIIFMMGQCINLHHIVPFSPIS